MSDARWLLLMCASRAAYSLIFTAYAAVIPLVQQEWGMSSAEAAWCMLGAGALPGPLMTLRLQRITAGARAR